MPTERNIHDASDNQEIDLENRKCDWSEHISSSGKKYYYNYRTEVSQWEKPKELSEWECKHLHTDRNRDFAEASSSSQPYTDYHHSSYQIHEGHPNSSCQNQTVVSHPKSHRIEDVYFQDMDISSDATPTSSPLRRTLAEIQPAQITTEQQQPVAVSLAQLPKLLCQLTRRENADLNPREALQTLKTALLISCQINNANITNPSQVAAHNDDVNSPIVDYNHDSPGGDSPTSSAASLHSYNTSPLFPQPQTPSFANYYKPHLISHVTGWQAEFVEEQANRYSMDAHNFANQNYTWITANLKMCRSQVRVSEIRATVQQQRVLFLRQQIKELEDLKSQNSFMSSSA